MKFFNPDGSASFCGNGSRCAVLYCFHQGIIQSNCSFITNDGIHQGQVLENENIKISIKSPVLVEKLNNGDFEVNTGSPHYVQIANSIDNIDFQNHCKSIRNNEKYFQNGINVNLVKVEDNFLDMRTYERGVEDETLSCGSGVTATALAIAYEKKIENSLFVKTRGGFIIDVLIFWRTIRNYHCVLYYYIITKLNLYKNLILKFTPYIHQHIK